METHCIPSQAHCAASAVTPSRPAHPPTKRPSAVSLRPVDFFSREETRPRAPSGHRQASGRRPNSATHTPHSKCCAGPNDRSASHQPAVGSHTRYDPPSLLAAACQLRCAFILVQAAARDLALLRGSSSGRTHLQPTRGRHLDGRHSESKRIRERRSAAHATSTLAETLQQTRGAV